MCRINGHTIVIFSTILLIHCEHWYSATITENTNQHRLQNTHFKNWTEKDTFRKGPGFTPSKYKNIEENRKRFSHTPLHPKVFSSKKFIHLNIFEIPGTYGFTKQNISHSFKYDVQKPVEVLNYNNTINLVNVITRTKPKRKIVKRICSESNMRSSKKINWKHPRFLEVFQVVEFEHAMCISSSGLEGTCLHEYECEANGGLMMGTCADGYGICCVTQFSCDEQTSEPMGWFTNPGYPSASSDRLSCTLTLNKASESINQIRLDFAAFELLGPTGGTCQQDQFIISGQNANSIVPILCGINTGQHVYIEVSDTVGPIYLSIETVAPENRLFSLKITQLTWADELAAPTGCLQFFNEPQGVLESFNYRDTSDIGITRIPSYFNNLNYAMCIRRAPDTCSITYTNDDYMQIINYDLDGLPLIPKGQAGVEIFNCPSDWLLISAIRLCGDRLNDGSILQDFALDAPVTDNNAGPISVWFRSDEGYVGRGFKLHYQQNKCNNPD